MYKIFGLLCLICSPSISSESINENRLSHICATQESCSNCLQTPTCIWCNAVDNRDGETITRCITRSKYSEDWCPPASVFNQTTTILMLENRSLSSNKHSEPVQIQPQRIKLILRKNEKIRFTLKYTLAEDYPVDLYYLMDLSRSMLAYKQHLAELGSDLASVMRDLTRNFRLGFGSFVDKVTLPMTDTQPAKLKIPCTYVENNRPHTCAPPYGYKHQMSLTEDSDSFKSNVNAAPISGNLDGPEGGLDAMMQAIVCLDRIGWRPKARHLLVYSTDASYHLAGDGRLAGIIEPNDCKCHLDSNGFYTHSLLQDYPSISQIKRKALEHNVNIIFAVPSAQEKIYKHLSQSIKGSAIGVVEKHDRLNVINLIKAEYKKLVQSIELVDNSTKDINLQYFSRCLNNSGEMKHRSRCDDIRFGDVIEFEVAVQMTECPLDRNNRKQTLKIKPRGINEGLLVELELACECPCESPDHPEFKTNAPECEGHGALICGACICNHGYHGKSCHCQGNEAQNETVNELLCRASVNDTKPCSNHGTCKCGICECEIRSNPLEKFSGKYCECNNFSCKRHEGVPCGKNGKCVCGKCECKPGYTGDSCECPDNSKCYPEGKDSQICNGHGDCICGVCHCKFQDDVLYSGPLCQDCPTCDGFYCNELRDCVECFVFKSGFKFKDNQCQNCYFENMMIDEVDKVEVNATEFEMGVRSCQVPTSDGCNFTFKYLKIEGRGDIAMYEITTEKVKRNCPEPVAILPLVIGITVSTVIIGFLTLLIWKVVTMVHDQREYVKFEKERAMAKWQRGENPLYKQATSTFTNPTFGE